jgi:hypothetical protein
MGSKDVFIRTSGALGKVRVLLCLRCSAGSGRAEAGLRSERAIGFLDCKQRSGFGSNEAA